VSCIKCELDVFGARTGDVGKLRAVYRAMVGEVSTLNGIDKFSADKITVARLEAAAASVVECLGESGDI
jgi:hypothetical protein